MHPRPAYIPMSNYFLMQRSLKSSMDSHAPQWHSRPLLNSCHKRPSILRRSSTSPAAPQGCPWRWRWLFSTPGSPAGLQWGLIDRPPVQKMGKEKRRQNVSSLIIKKGFELIWLCDRRCVAIVTDNFFHCCIITILLKTKTKVKKSVEGYVCFILCCRYRICFYRISGIEHFTVAGSIPTSK